MKQTYNIKKISEDILYNLGHFNNTESNVINAIDKILEGFTTLEEKYYRTPIIVPAFLMITSKKMFISAITLLQSLQLSSCYPLIRAVLENSIYSFYINSDTQKKNIYLKRNKDSTSKKENKNTFSMREIFKYLQEKSPTWNEIFHSQYENSIDKGAHPNLDVFKPYIKSNRDFSYSWDLFETNGEIIKSVAKDIIAAGNLSLQIYNDLFEAN